MEAVIGGRSCLLCLLTAIAILCKVRPDEDAVAALQAAVTITITRVITNTQSQLSTPASSEHNLQIHNNA